MEQGYPLKKVRINKLKIRASIRNCKMAIGIRCGFKTLGNRRVKISVKYLGSTAPFLSYN